MDTERTTVPDRTAVILVVEDDPPTQQLLSEVLRDAGYTVLVVDNGSAALSALNTARSDLVTLDLELPGIAGAEVLALIRDNEGLRGNKVLVISGMERIPTRVRQQADAVIRKPFDVSNLLKTVESLVPPRIPI